MEKSITKTRLVSESAERIWWRWTTHEGLRTFFGADNKIELNVGGAFEISFLMDAPEGIRGSEGCKILSYLPGKMLSFSWNAPPQFPDIRNNEYKTWVVVQLDSKGSEETEVTINHIGWPEGDDWQLVYNYFDSAWEKVLEWLAESATK